MVIGNALFEKKDKCKYTWVRQGSGRVVDRAVIGNVAVVVSRNVTGRLIGVSIERREWRRV